MVSGQWAIAGDRRMQEEEGGRGHTILYRAAGHTVTR
jgi:hypothetical protein